MSFIRRGFTVVELLVVLVLVCLLLVIGVPALRHLFHAVLIQHEAGRLMGAIILTRSESVERNVPVSLCPADTSTGGAAGCAGIYADGWMVFTNPDRDAAFDPARDTLIKSFKPLPLNYTLTNRSGLRNLDEPLTFLPDGTSRRSVTLMLCSPPGTGVESHSVVLNRVGRPRLARGWGQCPQ
jgi:type IV fimbrial biogenesis protein FimT